MKVYFATNRGLLKRGGRPQFGNDPSTHPLEYRVGHITVAPGTDSWVAKSASLHVAPERTKPGTDQREFAMRGSEALFAELMEVTRDDATGDLLIVIHGAAHSFESSVEVGARCAELYSDPMEPLPDDAGVGRISPRKPMIPFVFSYPPNGRSNPLDYFQDRYDASVSGPAIARAYARLIDFVAKTRADDRCGKKIHLVVHSLGNFALRSAVQAISSSAVMRPVRLFDSAILVHADEDNDALKLDQKLRPLTRLADDVVVYYDRTDKLVRLSDSVHDDRLGQKGPVTSTPMTAPGCRISALDCEATEFDLAPDRQRHRHYIKNRAVVNDIRQVIAGRDPGAISGRKPQDGLPGFYRL
ncbi:MAG: alpha/beta hydrolase [Minwuia sp.]|nr:alpha/beta hydrolase [Minwuia sp.]